MEDKDVYFMKEAYRLARQAYQIGEVPVGALIVKDGEIIGRGINRRESKNNPLAHAEIEAIDQASRRLKSWRLLDSILYVTLEPCAMCAGAIVNSRIKRVVIGARDLKRGCCGTVEDLTGNESFNHRAEVEFGLMEEECSSILSNFFKDLREGRLEVKK